MSRSRAGVSTFSFHQVDQCGSAGKEPNIRTLLRCPGLRRRGQSPLPNRPAE
jgi:hypothetical protein